MLACLALQNIQLVNCGCEHMSRQKRAMNITSSVKTMTRIQCECLFGFIIVERGRYTTHTHTIRTTEAFGIDVIICIDLFRENCDVEWIGYIHWYCTMYIKCMLYISFCAVQLSDCRRFSYIQNYKSLSKNNVLTCAVIIFADSSCRWAEHRTRCGWWWWRLLGGKRPRLSRQMMRMLWMMQMLLLLLWRLRLLLNIANAGHAGLLDLGLALYNDTTTARCLRMWNTRTRNFHNNTIYLYKLCYVDQSDIN